MSESKKKNSAVFLDRDSTLNYDPGYLDDPDKLQLLSGVGEGLKLLQEAGFKLIVITNQAGVGRGKFSIETLEAIHQRLREKLKAYHIQLTAIYYCPHHPDENCPCRKPKTFLVEQAVKTHQIDLSRSFMVGDNQCDVDMARNLACPFVLLGERDLNWHGLRFSNMVECADYILQARATA